MSEQVMTLKLRVWRQSGPKDTSAGFREYTIDNVSSHMSFLEMLDLLNEKLIRESHPDGPIAFDSDCREGICGSCGIVINGVPHGPEPGTTCCQLHFHNFIKYTNPNDTIVVEPWRAKPFPIVKDLVVDREAFDKIVTAGGYVSFNAGAAPDANEIPIGKDIADRAMDAAACIGCGACVAACKNAAAHLFTGAKVTQFALLPQGQPEREHRVLRMVDTMEELGFGDCSNEGECEAVCPKEISTEHISRLIREYARAIWKAV